MLRHRADPRIEASIDKTLPFLRETTCQYPWTSLQGAALIIAKAPQYHGAKVDSVPRMTRETLDSQKDAQSIALPNGDRVTHLPVETSDMRPILSEPMISKVQPHSPFPHRRTGPGRRFPVASSGERAHVRPSFASERAPEIPSTVLEDGSRFQMKEGLYLPVSRFTPPIEQHRALPISSLSQIRVNRYHAAAFLAEESDEDEDRRRRSENPSPFQI